MKSPEEVLKSPGAVVAFAGLRLDPARRVLQRGDDIVHLYPRSFDALVLLIERRGEVVSKDTLMDQLWPGVIVEENSLARLISDLRKAIGDAGRCIVTVPKRGYRFDGAVEAANAAEPSNRSRDAEANSLFDRGRYWLTRRAWDDAMSRAIACFEGAVARDPDFADAHSALAEAHLTSGVAVLGKTHPPLMVIPRARAAAERALSLDPRLAGARAVLAHIALCFDWDWPRARAMFEAAVRSDPRHVGARQYYAIGLLATGDFDGALHQLDMAREVDAASLLTRANVGFVLSRAGRLDEAMRELERCLELEPGFAYARYRYGLALQAAGRLEAAERQFEGMAMAAGARIPMLAAQAHLAAAMGDVGKARKLTSALSVIAETSYVSAWFFAEIAAGLGDVDGAIDWIEKALAERSLLVIALEYNFKLDPLRARPRFTDIRRRMGFWR
ncbi:MAG: tetratricopeptide repeat protein [Alphaproteobacteria bacterium]|nr:tetratricopeptide repeat protein [Alphaproteobacteria bacterium]